MTRPGKLNLNFSPVADAPKPARELGAVPVIESCGESGAIVLAVVRPDGSSLAIHLGPAEAVAVAGELIQAARARMGRLDWPPATATAENAP